MNQRLSILRRLKNKVPQDKLRIIAGAIFTSVARYGIAVYSKPRLHLDPMREDMNKLQVIQNKMFRPKAERQSGCGRLREKLRNYVHQPDGMLSHSYRIF